MSERMWSPSLMQLDLSRRRVAAISFLSNIPTDNEPTEIRLDCLQDTHVLRDFQRKKRQRKLYQELRQQSVTKNVSLKSQANQGGKPRPVDDVEEESYENGTEFEPKGRIARKLTFSKGHLDAEVDKIEVIRKISKAPEANLLHLDMSRVASVPASANQTNSGLVGIEEKQCLPKSAPIPTTAPGRQQPPGFFDQNVGETAQELKLNIRRKGRSDEPQHESFTSKLIGSNESLGGNLQAMTLATRLRKISGNLSENSSCSLKEIRFFRNRLNSEDDGVSIKNYHAPITVEERLVFVAGEKKIPFAIFSVIPVHKTYGSTKVNHRRHSLSRLSIRSDHRVEMTGNRRHHANSFSKQLTCINDGIECKDPLGIVGVDRTDDHQETSYHHLLVPTPVSMFKGCQYPNAEEDQELLRLQGIRSHNSGDVCGSTSPCNELDVLSSSEAFTRGSNINYNPFLLDGWLIVGKHRKLLPFPSYMTSVIEYAKPSELKRELNQKFRERFPHLNISLTKLRSIKREMKKISLSECNLDLLTLSISYVYFEILVLKSVVNKMNRKACAGSCLILAAKLNDVKGQSLSTLIERIENVFRVGRKDLLSSEFAVLVALEFTLHVPTWQIYPHYQRLLHEV